jgi:hypothetical protein
MGAVNSKFILFLCRFLLTPAASVLKQIIERAIKPV